MTMIKIESLFEEIAIILGIACIFSWLGQKFRQPLIIMFLLTGIVSGPSVLGIVQNYEQIELLAHIGVALLLFIVGLRLDLNVVRTLGSVALATGIGQILFTSIVGFMVCLLLGIEPLGAIYISVALTFSSTIIIVKLLSDKKEIDSLHGQIAIGFLIVQDLAAIIALVILSTITKAVGIHENVVFHILRIIGMGILLLIIIIFLAYYILPRVTRQLAASQEMLLIFSISWAVLLAALTEWVGFSKEMGAFLGGVSLASTPYRDAISARLSTIRDFLLLFFFLDLGARMEWVTIGSQLFSAGILSLFVLIGNPLIVLVIMGWMGYRRRTSFFAGLTVAQISEFSLIITNVGVELGHLSQENMGLVTLVGIITIFLSTYMILYSHQLYEWMANWLRIFERKNPFREMDPMRNITKTSPDILLLGVGNFGRSLAHRMLQRNHSILGIDFDPNLIQQQNTYGIPMIYGDISDPELYQNLPLSGVHWVVCTIRSFTINLTLLKLLQFHGFKGRIAVTALDEKDSEILKQSGAHVVFNPLLDAAEQAVDLLVVPVQIEKQNVDWPLEFCEIRIPPDSEVVGKTIRSLDLRRQTGVSILAISRRGQIYYQPEPDFVIFPGDRCILTGTREALNKTQQILSVGQIIPHEEQVSFLLAELEIGENSSLIGNSLRTSKFYQTYQAIVVGIRRKTLEITSVSPDEIFQQGDRLVLIGLRSTIEKLQKQRTL